jgi:hypothetical protein
MAITNDQAKKATELQIKDTRTNEITKVVQLQDTQIGLTSNPKDLIVIGDTSVGGDATFEGDIQVTGSLFSPHISGSLTKTINGLSYLVVSGSQLSITSGSSTGQIQIGSTVVSKALTSDFTTASTTRQSSNFTFPVNANEVWDVEFDGALGCSSANGVQFAWDAPVGSTASSRIFGCTVNAATFSSTFSTTINSLIGFTLSNVAGPAPRYARIAATITIGSTAGNVTLQMAVVVAGTARIYAGSHFTAKRVLAV